MLFFTINYSLLLSDCPSRASMYFSRKLIWMSADFHASFAKHFCQLFTHHYEFETWRKLSELTWALHCIKSTNLCFCGLFDVVTCSTRRFMIIKQCFVNRELKRAIWSGVKQHYMCLRARWWWSPASNCSISSFFFRKKQKPEMYLFICG